MYTPILMRDHQTMQTVIEFPQTFGLCYRCHTRTALTVDTPGRFPHAKHLKKNVSCAACHDAHGTGQYPHLINFMLLNKNGLPVVSRSTAQQRLKYVPKSNGGQCYLNCHGVIHEPSTYP